MENFKINVSSYDIYLLFMRFDKNLDGRISYSEFLQEITPTSPKKFY